MENEEEQRSGKERGEQGGQDLLWAGSSWRRMRNV